MKHSISGFCLLFLFSAINILQSKPDAIIGRWMSSENNLMVDVFKVGEEYKAKLVWFDDTDDKNQPMSIRLDTKNPDKTLQTRKLIGINVLWNLYYNSDDEEWQNGEIYDSSSGKKWDAKAWINKEGLLKVRGYWKFSLFGETMNFKRIK